MKHYKKVKRVKISLGTEKNIHSITWGVELLSFFYKVRASLKLRSVVWNACAGLGGIALSARAARPRDNNRTWDSISIITRKENGPVSVRLPDGSRAHWPHCSHLRCLCLTGPAVIAAVALATPPYAPATQPLSNT